MKNIKCLDFDYANIEQKDSVVVLGAGPSLAKNADKIRDYVRDNGSVIIGANHNFESIGICSDYTLISDNYVLAKTDFSSLNSHVVMPVKTVGRMSTRKDAVLRKTGFSYEDTIAKLRKHSKRFNTYQVGTPGTKGVFATHWKLHWKEAYLSGMYDKDKSNKHLKIKDGRLLYKYFGIAGIATFLVSVVFRPKKILVVGIDGVEEGVYQKEMFDGTVKRFKKSVLKRAKDTCVMERLIIPSMHRMGIGIETYEDVRLHGLDKKKLGLSII